MLIDFPNAVSALAKMLEYLTSDTDSNKNFVWLNILIKYVTNHMKGKMSCILIKSCNMFEPYSQPYCK